MNIKTLMRMSSYFLSTLPRIMSAIRQKLSNFNLYGFETQFKDWAR